MVSAKQIRFESGGRSTLEVSKGELVYLQHNKNASAYFIKLLGVSNNTDLEVSIHDEKISQLVRTSVADHRQKIAYISSQLNLDDTDTVEKSITTYLESIGAKYKAATIDPLLQKFELSKSEEVSGLSELEQFLLRVTIGLAKNPEIIILENPLAQISDEEYTKVMDKLYNMIIEKGITCLVSLSNPNLVDYFPGRVVRL